MELSQIIPHIEALIFASDKPLTAVELVEYVNNALGFIEDQASLQQVEAAIEGIKEKYDSEFYAFELKQSGGGWQFLTKPQFHKTVALINGDKFIKKLSTAALETLAIIAYKQPVTKSEMESIRGVNCDYAVQKLLEKDLVVISGRNEDAVGKPLVYSTSKSFMDYFGINSANDLPKISEVLMQEYEKATAMEDIITSRQMQDDAVESSPVPTPVEEAEEGLDEAAIDRPEQSVVLDTEELEISKKFDTSAIEENAAKDEEEIPAEGMTVNDEDIAEEPMPDETVDAPEETNGEEIELPGTDEPAIHAGEETESRTLATGEPDGESDIMPEDVAKPETEDAEDSRTIITSEPGQDPA